MSWDLNPILTLSRVNAFITVLPPQELCHRIQIPFIPSFSQSELLEKPGSLKLQAYLSIYFCLNTEAKYFHHVREMFPTQAFSWLSSKAVVSDLALFH